MNIPQFKVNGKNRDTNRRKTIIVRAFDETEAKSLALEQGILEPYELEEIPSEPATSRQIDYARDLGIPIPMNATKDEMSMLISYKVDDDIDFSKLPKRSGRGWAQWNTNIHKEKSQSYRQERAKSSQYIPIKLFTNEKEAVFKASENDMHYLTTLEDCQCLDYMRRGKPCKHMYRLAHELGLIDLSLTTASNITFNNPTYDGQPPISKTPWYQNLGIIILLFIFVFPIGVFLFWKYVNLTRTAKIILSIILGVFWLIMTLVSLST